MVLSDPHEALADHVARLNARGVTHISGTPSHWRKLLMSGSAAQFAPRYVRLSGEIADQAVLDGLKAGVSRMPPSAMPMPRPRPASALPSMTGWKVFRPTISATATASR